MQPVALATTYHDPYGILHDQLEHHLPQLQQFFAGIAANVSPDLHPPTMELLRRAKVKVVEQKRQMQKDGVPALGQVRRSVVNQALKLDTPFVMYCDGDRILHWVECYPDELATVIKQVTDHDFTILGRTPRAFGSHPRNQYDTEVLINNLYARLSGYRWDITAAARGLSRRAAQAIVDGCPDNSIGVDASWPLFLQRIGGFALTMIETEGLEFETATQYPKAVQAAGGEDAWKAQLDADPQRWIFRLDVAKAEIEAMQPYVTRK